MPTLSFTWTDLALLALTAGLIGGVILVGRAVGPTPPDGQASLNPKRKKTRKKKSSNNNPPSPPCSPSVRQSSGSNQHAAIKSTRSQDRSPDLQSNVKTTGPPRRQESTQFPQNLDEAEFPPLNAQTLSTAPKHNPKRPLAERKKAPPRKTMVDDMIDEDVEKPLSMARVMAIVGPKAPTVAAVESDPEDGWEKVEEAKKPRASGSASGPSVSRTIVHPQKSGVPGLTPPLSKRQRQNARKKEAEKAVKDAEEAERLKRLDNHKRQQENVRIKAQAAAKHK